MPTAVERRRRTPLSPSEFFQPRNELSKSKKFRLAIKNWLNGLPVKQDEDVLRGIESEQFLLQTSSPVVQRKRKRDYFKLKRRKRTQTDVDVPVTEVEMLPDEKDPADSEDGLSGKQKKKPKDDRPAIRIINVPTPHPHHHHLLWLHHQENGGDKRDDLTSYTVTNRIRTAKYSLVTFLPKNLFEQFRRVANCYFLFIVILQAIPVISNYNVGLAALPLIIIVAITAAKDAFEDYNRYKQDQLVNYSYCRALKRPETVPLEDEEKPNWFRRTLRKLGLLKLDRSQMPSPASHLPTEKFDWERKYWQDIRVGDLVYLTNNEMIPADILILATSEPDSACYVETKNLDGETNLKVKKGPAETAWIQTADDAAEFKGQIEVELPSSNLYNFYGRLVLPSAGEDQAAGPSSSKKKTDNEEDEESSEDENSGGFMSLEKNEPKIVPVSTSALILRGCVLRNTNYVIGVVAYTGPHTKLILNSGGTPSKRSRIERQMNPQIILNFALLFVICLVCAIVQGALASGVMSNAPYWVSSFEESGGYSSSMAGFLTFWSSVILFQTLVPISLYLTVELCKTAQAFLIHSDIEMYHKETDTACVPRAWNLSDDLGQIEYLFSDKTGTLTRNIMEFRRISIGGKTYGFLEAGEGMMDSEHGQMAVDKIGTLEDQMNHELTDLLPYSYVPPTKHAFIDPALYDDLRANPAQAQRITDFFTLLIVCHTVLIERLDGGHVPQDDKELELAPHQLLFKAQSPDEAALVATSRDLGMVFLGREQERIKISILGKIEHITVLNVIEFNSTRKRMSIIVKRQDGRIQLFSKGADNVIYDRLLAEEASSEIGRITLEHLELFAEAGLRTLCLAYRDLDEYEYKYWVKSFEAAASSIHDRDLMVDAVCDELEKGLKLLGATAIEDQLQEGVPECIERLQRAGIKIWVLTGDKLETAINIGFSCRLLNKEMLLLTVKSADAASAREQLRSAYEQIWSQYFSFGGGSGFNLPGQTASNDGDLSRAGQKQTPTEYALIIEGSSLKHAFDPSCRKLFMDLASKCTAVICCRVSPLQKAKVVELMKRGKNVMTMAIGDGANDVSMIQAADVGVGISGQEGMQAVMSSDYAISQFRFLTRLLLVHGRWSYIRTAEVTLVSFYKNIFFVVLLFWYQFYCGFTAEYVYDYMYLLFFNLIFSVIPLLVLGIFDQDLQSRMLIGAPPIYSRGIRQKSYSMQMFGLYVLDAIYQSLVCFFIPLAAYGENGLTASGYTENKALIGNVMALSVIISCNLYMVINTFSWTIFTFIALPLALVLPLVFLGLYSLFPSQDLYGTWRVFLEPIFWVTLSICVVISLTPRILIKYLQTQFKPNDVDISREMAKYGGAEGEARLMGTLERVEEQVGRKPSMDAIVVQPPRLVHRETSKDLGPVLPTLDLSSEEQPPLRHSASSFFAESLRRRLVPLGSARSSKLRVFNLRTGRFEKINGFAFSQDEGMRGLIEGRATAAPFGRGAPPAPTFKAPQAPPAAANRRT